MTTGSNDARIIHIIDDDELVRYLIKRCSKIALPDVITHEYSSAEEFLEFVDEIIDEKVPLSVLSRSLVTLDLRMPGMGGLDALQRIQERIEDKKLPDVPFHCLVLTSSNSKLDQDTVSQYGFVSRYCVKPMTTDLMQEIVDKHPFGSQHPSSSPGA